MSIKNIKEAKVYGLKINYAVCPYCKYVVNEDSLGFELENDNIILCPYCKERMRIKKEKEI